METLPPIPASVTTREEYEIDTSGLIWRMPPELGIANLDWTRFETTPGMLQLLMSYIVAIMKGRSESTVSNAYRYLLAVRNWELFTNPWAQNGKVELQDILVIKRHMEETYKCAWKEYFRVVKRLYEWAAGKGVPGFTLDTCDELKRIRIPRWPSLAARLNVAPGAPRSKTAKNRRVYTETDLILITAYLHRAEAILRNGQTLYCPLSLRHSKAKEGCIGVVRKNGQLLRPSPVILSHLVLGWLTLHFGDRPSAFRKLRESHFEFFQSGGVTVAQIRMPESKIRHSNYRAIQGPLGMGDELARLVPDLIAENRKVRERLGMDNSQDWPLFMVAQEGRSASWRKRVALAHEDPTKSVEKRCSSLSYDLKILFNALQVPDGNGGVINPTFYSFRDTLVTNWIASGKPPEVIAALQNKQVESLKPYNVPGVTFTERLDLVPDFKQLAAAFRSNDPIRQAEVTPRERVPAPFVEIGEEDKTLIGFTGRCGCVGASCPIAMSGSVDCYLCPAFTAAVEGPHEKVLSKLWTRRNAMIDAELPEREYKRYDRHIAVCGEILRRIQVIEVASL